MAPIDPAEAPFDPINATRHELERFEDSRAMDRLAVRFSYLADSAEQRAKELATEEFTPPEGFGIQVLATDVFPIVEVYKYGNPVPGRTNNYWLAEDQTSPMYAKILPLEDGKRKFLGGSIKGGSESIWVYSWDSNIRVQVVDGVELQVIAADRATLRKRL